MLQHPVFTRLGWGADDHTGSEQDEDSPRDEEVEVRTSKTEEQSRPDEHEVGHEQQPTDGDAARARTAERYRAEPIRVEEVAADEQTVDSVGDESSEAVTGVDVSTAKPADASDSSPEDPELDDGTNRGKVYEASGDQTTDAEVDWTEGAVQEPDADPVSREIPLPSADTSEAAGVEPAGDSDSGSDDRPELDAVSQQVTPRSDLPGSARATDPPAQAERVSSADVRLRGDEDDAGQHTSVGAQETQSRDDLEVSQAGADTTVTADDMERRRYSLGYDPAVGKFRETEAETAVRVEAEREVTLARAARRDAFDWVDHDGRTYDAVGNFPARFFDAEWGHLQVRIIDHLEKAEFVPVDVSKFTAEQRSLVREFVDRFDGRVFVVGDE